MLDKRNKGLSLVFVLVGLVFLVPFITGEALAYTASTIKAGIIDPLFTFVDKRLDEGRWVIQPYCTNGEICHWTTAGKAIGGPEAGHVIYNLASKTVYPQRSLGQVLVRWYNPRSGTNTCGSDVLRGPDPYPVPGVIWVTCTITQGIEALANYDVHYRAPAR